MKAASKGVEALTVRRAKVADADKVRYRVYRTPTDFIAVIAENALMAVKVSGVSKPHKIVRDFPTEGVAIEAQRMATIEAKPEKVALGGGKSLMPGQRIVAQMPKPTEAMQSEFKPMTLGDLQKNAQTRARILPPELLTEIIDAHNKAISATTAPPLPDPEKTPASEPPPPEPSLSPQEKLMQMAETLPPGDDKAAKESELSPEDVEKLLNG